MRERRISFEIFLPCDNDTFAPTRSCYSLKLPDIHSHLQILHPLFELSLAALWDLRPRWENDPDRIELLRGVRIEDSGLGQLDVVVGANGDLSIL